MGPSLPSMREVVVPLESPGRGMLKGVQPPPEPSLSTSGFYHDSIRGIRKQPQTSESAAPGASRRL